MSIRIWLLCLPVLMLPSCMSHLLVCPGQQSHSPDAVGRLAGLGRNPRVLAAKFGSQLAFAGSTMIGTHQLVELHRFRTTADLDACLTKVDSVTFMHGYLPATTLRLLVPLPFSPWQ